MGALKPLIRARLPPASPMGRCSSACCRQRSGRVERAASPLPRARVPLHHQGGGQVRRRAVERRRQRDLRRHVLQPLARRHAQAARVRSRRAAPSSARGWACSPSTPPTTICGRRRGARCSIASTAPPERAGDGPSALDDLLEKERWGYLNALLADFSERDRRFVELYYGAGLLPEEVAAAMGISVKTVYSKKNKLRTKLLALAEHDDAARQSRARPPTAVRRSLLERGGAVDGRCGAGEVEVGRVGRHRRRAVADAVIAVRARTAMRPTPPPPPPPKSFCGIGVWCRRGRW